MNKDDYVYKKTGEFAMTFRQYIDMVIREMQNHWEYEMSVEDRADYSFSVGEYISQEIGHWLESDEQYTTYEAWKTQKEYEDEWKEEYDK